MNGKVALITGASSGIGSATAKMLAQNGVSVGLFARREERLTALAKDIESEGGSALVLKGDITKREEDRKSVV